MMGGRGGWGLSNAWNAVKSGASSLARKAVAAAKNPANQAKALALAKTYGPTVLKMGAMAAMGGMR